jgi:hypothetical protein
VKPLAKKPTKYTRNIHCCFSDGDGQPSNGELESRPGGLRYGPAELVVFIFYFLQLISASGGWIRLKNRYFLQAVYALGPLAKYYP